MEYDVTIDREKFIGGSDIPAIMGLSPFTTRWDLLLEKAGLKERDFQGNKYTEYGHIIEPKIREYINSIHDMNFEPNQVIDGDLRFHTDGFDTDTVLEIKSTSKVHKTVGEYKAYLVQLLKYMEANKAAFGILAVYHRPEDFSEEFDPNRLQKFEIEICDHLALLGEVNEEIDRFRSDLKMLKENPLMTEEDFLPTAVVEWANKVAVLESRMAEYKAIEAEYKRVKQSLYEAMEKHGIKTWQTFNGTKITRVDGIPEGVKAVNEFDEKAFAESHPRLYKQYSKVVQKKTAAKSGYVKITLSKG